MKPDKGPLDQGNLWGVLYDIIVALLFVSAIKLAFSVSVILGLIALVVFGAAWFWFTDTGKSWI
jgi:hypothetical protein